MKNLHNILMLELYRAIFSFKFLVIVFTVTLILFIGSSSELSLAKDVLYLFKYSIEASGLGYLLPLIGSLPHAASFAADYTSKYYRMMLSRTTPSGYAWSKVISCSLAGGISIIIGITIYLLRYAIRYPLVSSSAANYEYFVAKTIGGNYLTTSIPAIYFIICLILIFFYCIFWSCIGLCVSSFIPNTLVSYFSPFILSYILNAFSKQLPTYIRLKSISNGTVIIQNFSFSLIYAICVFTFLTLLFGLITHNKIVWRIQND